MKRLIAILAAVLLPISVMAGGTVMVSTNDSTILWPTNFIPANAIATTNVTGSLADRIAALEGTTNGVWATTTQVEVVTANLASLSNGVAIITTNYATKAQNLAVSNRVSVLETNRLGPYSFASHVYVGSNLVVTGSVTAASFSGDGSGLTNLIAATTAGVNRIIVGGVTNIGDITFDGTRVSATEGTVTFTNVEYISQTVVPASSTWEMFFQMPRDENITMVKVWGQVDAYNCTFSIVEAASNDAWRAVSTNLADIVAPVGGIWATNFTDAVIEAGNRWGIRITDLDPRTMSLTYGIQIKY